MSHPQLDFSLQHDVQQGQRIACRRVDRPETTLNVINGSIESRSHIQLGGRKTECVISMRYTKGTHPHNPIISKNLMSDCRSAHHPGLRWETIA